MIASGEKVTLGVITKENLAQLWGWRNDPRIWKWCRQFDLITWEQHVSWFESLATRKDVRMYTILDGEKTVGVCGFTDIDHLNQRAEFSLYIGPEFHRKGYARAALKTLFAHGFKSLGLNVIWGETFDKNPALKLFQSLGMIKEGTRQQFYYRDGKFIDCHLISLTRSTWAN